jgi:hypothetical protein
VDHATRHWPRRHVLISAAPSEAIREAIGVNGYASRHHGASSAQRVAQVRPDRDVGG